MITMKAELHSACYGVERAEVGGHSAVYKTKIKITKMYLKKKNNQVNKSLIQIKMVNLSNLF